MFKYDDRKIKEFEADLKAFADRAYPFATKNTLNSSAFKAQQLSRRNASVNMIERNQFTGRSIQVEQCRTLHVNSQEAVTGSIVDYMADQEFGKVRRRSGSIGVPIPTAYSAGQGDNVQTRTRLPTRANKLVSINLYRRRVKYANKKQKLLVMVNLAVKNNERFFYYESGGTKGIFKVVGGRRTGRGWPKGAQLKMIYDMSRPAVVIPRNPWLKPAVDTVQYMMPSIHEKSLIFQLKRLGLFRG